MTDTAGIMLRTARKRQALVAQCRQLGIGQKHARMQRPGWRTSTRKPTTLGRMRRLVTKLGKTPAA